MSKTESFEFLNELALAFRAAENHPRPQYAPVLEGIRAVLAHLSAAGRLIPAGGMALTAEQVEGVRTVLDAFASERDECDTWDLYDRVRALFPATEPAEDGWGDVNPNDPQGRTYRETAEEYYSTPAEPAAVEVDPRAESQAACLYAKLLTAGEDPGLIFQAVLWAYERVKSTPEIIWLEDLYQAWESRASAEATVNSTLKVPAPAEPAEATINSMLMVPAFDEVSGNNVAECNSSTGGDVQAKKITRAWMLHLGYSEDHVDSLEQATHEGYGCEHNPFGGWDCIDESGASQHQDWDEYDNIAQIVMFVLERIPAVTSAEPIEEEAMLAARGEGWYEGYEVGLEYGPIAASGEEYEGPINPYDVPASSPVVPAPTESEWKRIEDVPDGVCVKSAKLPYPHRWPGGVHRDVPADYIEAVNTHYAPFVASEEG